MQTVSNYASISTTKYPRAFDGTKTIRPGLGKLTPLPSQVKEEDPALTNDLQFSPAVSCKSLKELFAAASEMDREDLDEMHVSSFEKLMRTTGYNLTAVQPEPMPKADRCKVFLSVNVKRKSTISRADFNKARQAEEALCSAQVLIDCFSRLLARLQAAFVHEPAHSKLRSRFSHC